MNKESPSSYKYVILAASVMLSLCLGATYSWSVYVESLKELLHISQAQAQYPFTTFYVFFPTTMLFSGFLLDRWGMRWSALAGIVIFSCSWIATGFWGTQIGNIIFFNGVLGGIGVGLVYMIPIKACMQWFPQHKGLATGVAVAGFGGGAALLSQLARYLLQSLHYPVLQVYLLFGISFLILGGISALLMKSPDSQVESSASFIRISTILRDPMFRLLFVGMLAGLAGGFAVISNLKQIYSQATPLMGATAVSLLAICNAAGRIIWGAMHDKLPGRKIVCINLAAQAMLLLLGAFFIHSVWAFYLFAAFIGFNYGGVLVLYAAEGGRIWGPEKLPKIYGWVFWSNVPASMASVYAGFMFDRFGAFSSAFWSLSILLMITTFYLYLKFPAGITKK